MWQPASARTRALCCAPDCGVLRIAASNAPGAHAMAAVGCLCNHQAEWLPAWGSSAHRGVRPRSAFSRPALFEPSRKHPQQIACGWGPFTLGKQSCNAGLRSSSPKHADCIE